MPNAYCLCPDFLVEKISDPDIFVRVFIDHLINSEHQIVIDEREQLFEVYQTKAASKGQDAFSNLKVWLSLLNRDNGKLLITRNGNSNHIVDNEFYEFIYKVICFSPTTFNKSIVANDNNSYQGFIDDLRRQHIMLLNVQNLLQSRRPSGSNLSYDELDKNLKWNLQRLQRSYNSKKTEDELNDYVRDLLKSQLYEVCDQTREGVSSSGNSTGELDIIIEDQGVIFSIIELMKLKSLDKNYLDIHYKKLMVNYNPTCVKRSFLVTYYLGENISLWWDRYVEHISNIDADFFDGRFVIGNVDVMDTELINIKKLVHHMYVQDEHIACIHYAVMIPKDIR
ncbi:hypothetical protein [Providencia sp. PROV092]|uniref:hypothetical protein n=1 Tax=Providencia sp. PROV092 TaxID=2949808 RepID=UPI00234B447D|nr:hypothetical protein [Providencia sp. PROV092]